MNNMTNEQETLDLLNLPFSFRKRPVPLNSQSRIIWGISVLALILYICSRGKKSSITRLHILNWAVRSSENKSKMIELLENRIAPSAIFIKYDPGFNRAIEYAIAEGLVEVQGKARVLLLNKGSQLAREIIEDSECFEETRIFLQNKGSLLTEGLSTQLLKS